MPQYSNFRAGCALVRASLQAILRSPSAVVFGLAFPLVFILVFGMLSGGKKTFSATLSLAPGADTLNNVYRGLKNAEGISWKTFPNASAQQDALRKGEVTALINIQRPQEVGTQPIKVQLQGPASEAATLAELRSSINNVIIGSDPVLRSRLAEIASVSVTQTEMRAYRTIDFILPGQLGFSLLAGSVFGTAFVFFGLRQTLVLKRFFATPVRRSTIVVSEGIARMTFQMLTAIVIIAIGHFAFGFTLINGAATFLQLLALSALAIMVFMGFGFVVSNLAKTDAVIPALSNMITLPQFLLAGTFFPIDVFPAWLQPAARILPLSFLNDAMRKVSFDGAGFAEIAPDLLGLTLWGVGLYAVASRIFKWE